MKASRQRDDDESGDGDLPRSLPSVPAARLAGHDGPINDVRFTADGKYCLTAGHDRTVRLWNPTRFDPAYSPQKQQGEEEEDDDKVGGGGRGRGAGAGAATIIPHALPIQTYSDGHSHPIAAVAIDAQSTTIVSTSDRTLVVTDAITRRVKRRFPGHAGRINAVACSDGAPEAFLSGSYDGTVRIYDGRSWNVEPIQVLAEATDSVTAVVVVQDDGGGGGGATAEIMTASVDGTVRTYDLRMGQVRCDSVGEAITDVAITHDGHCVVASCLDGSLRLLERSTGDLLQTYGGGHVAGKYGLRCDFTAHDSYVVSGSEDGAVVLYDLVGGTVVQTLGGVHRRPTCAVAAHPRGEWSSVVLSASYDGEAVVWANPLDVARWER